MNQTFDCSSLFIAFIFSSPYLVDDYFRAVLRGQCAPRKLARLTLEEREQILVDLVLVGRAHAVRQARIDFQRGALDDLGGEQG